MVFLDASNLRQFCHSGRTTLTRENLAFRNLPIGGASILSNIFFFNPPKGAAGREDMPLRKKLEEMDFIGATFIISAVVCILLALQWAGSTRAWSSPTIIGLLVGFVILLAIFCVIQWKLGEKATIPPRIFFQRTILGGAWYFFFMEVVVNTVSAPCVRAMGSCSNDCFP